MELNKSYAYREAYSEVYFILLNMEWSDVKKIPKDIINVIRKNRIKNYAVNIEPSIPLQYQELKKETKSILALLYRKYLCDEAKKEEIEKNFSEKLKLELSQKKDKKENNELVHEEIRLDEVVLDNIIKENKLVVKKENAFSRLLIKILAWFKKDKQ